MADKEIGDLTVATTPLAGTELVEIVQGGNSRQTTVADLAASVDASDVPYDNSGSLLSSTDVQAAIDELALATTAADGDKGDVTVSGGGTTWTIDAGAVTYAKMQDVSATARVLGRKTAGSGDTEELTFSEVLDFVGSAAQGDLLYRNATAWVRLGAGTSGHFLKTQGAGANPAWAAVSGATIADADYGDITVSSAGTVMTIDNDVVTNAKAANMATATFKGRTTAGTGDPEDLTATQATALLNAMVGDSGSGGTKGLAPAPASGDAAAQKYLKADGTWGVPSGSGASTSTTMTAGNGLTGGGDLSTNRTFDVGAGTGITVNANDVQIATAYQAIGKQTVWVPATAMTARTTNGAASGTAEMATNKNMVSTLDFDTTTQEFAQFDIAMPKGWDNGTVTFVAYWSHAATTTNFGVAFGLDAVAISDDDTLDVAFGTAGVVTDTGGTTNDLYASSESSAITIAGTPATGDMVQFRIHRDPANGSDTMAIDARLHGVKLFFTLSAANDA